MINYLQHKSKQNRYSSDHYAQLRLIEDFYNAATEGMTDAGCHYFAHNFIKNREELIINSFSASPSPEGAYWENYWDCNPQEYDRYTISKKIGFQCAKPPQQTKWILGNSEPQNKIEMCKMKDGFHFSIQHDNGVWENFSFGWEKYDADHMTHQKVHNFSHKMDELNIGYFRLNADMFDTYPAVY